MIKIIWLLLIAVLMTDCGYDTRCLEGCPPRRPKVVHETTEVTKTVTAVGQPGPAGERGLPGESIQGPQGNPGLDAAPCTVEQLDTGFSVTCNGQTVGVYNGRDGTDGTDASLPPGTVVSTINPCGDGTLDEVILVTADGTLIAHYSDGQRQHLTVLAPGRYSTTDGHACNFSVDEENNLTWEDGE